MLFYSNEVWLSLVEQYVRDVWAAGSNPVTSTIFFPEDPARGGSRLQGLLFFCLCGEVTGAAGRRRPGPFCASGGAQDICHVYAALPFLFKYYCF